MSDAAVERYLDERLAEIDPHHHPGALSRSVVAGVEQTIEAFLTLALLDNGEAAEWRRRLSLLAADPWTWPPCPPATRAAAEAHLNDLLARAESAQSGDVEIRLHGALEALRGAGVLTDARAAAWLRRSPNSPERAAQVTASDASTAANAGPPVVLVGVLAGPPQRVGAIRVTAVELYRDAVTLHWHTDHAEQAPLDLSRRRRLPSPLERFALGDERGTAYRVTGAHGTGAQPHPRVQFGSVTFSPAPPPGIDELRFSVDGASLLINLAPLTA